MEGSASSYWAAGPMSGFRYLPVMAEIDAEELEKLLGEQPEQPPPLFSVAEALEAQASRASLPPFAHEPARGPQTVVAVHQPRKPVSAAATPALSAAASAAPAAAAAAAAGGSARGPRHSSLLVAAAAAAAAASSEADSQHTMSLYLESRDESLCRFAVKNETKECNRSLECVQTQGYVEYKARYARRGVRYGSFHVAFLPRSKTIFPFLRDARAADSDHQCLLQSNLDFSRVDRVDITARFFQPLRGTYPVRVLRFGDDETYQPMFAGGWDDTEPRMEGLTVTCDPDGEYIRYSMERPAAHAALLQPTGIAFPCPIPAHLDRLNDVGTLRMQVTVSFIKVKDYPYHSQMPGVMPPPPDDELHAWVKIRVVQQLSGQKRSFAQMTRDGEGSSEWALPPTPTLVLPPASAPTTLRHVLGKASLEGAAAVDVIQALATDVASRARNNVDKSAIHAACESGQHLIVRLLLQHDSTLVLQRTPRKGWTPLHTAAAAGHALVVAVLLEHGALTSFTTEAGETPMDLAAQSNRRAVVEALAVAMEEERDCKVSPSCLIRAAGIGRMKWLKRCLEAGLGPNIVNASGVTPLELAIVHNHTLCVYVLLAAGADISHRNHTNDTPLHIAAQRGFASVVTTIALFGPSTVNLVADGATPLHRSASRGQVLCVSILVSLGSDCTATDARGRMPVELAGQEHPGTHKFLLHFLPASLASKYSIASAPARYGGTLHYAASVGDSAMTRKLLAQGLNPNEPDARGNTPIKLAALHGHVLVLQALLSHHLSSPARGTSIDIPGNDGATPLHAACGLSAVGCLLVLLASKATSVNAVDPLGNTALHRAASLGVPIYTAFLLLAGANPSLRNRNGKLPHDVATEAGHSSTAAVLLSSEETLARVARALEEPPPARMEPLRVRLDQLPDNCLLWPGFDSLLARIWQNVHGILKRLAPLQ